MKNNTKNIQKGITAILFAAMMMVSVLAVVSPVQATSGELYAGGSNPGYVYEYNGGTPWGIISPNLGYAVLDLVEYDGHLYAGIKSSLDWSTSVGQVYRYDGGTTWTLVGNNMDLQVCSLAVYQSDLYAGTGWNGMNLYKYTPGTTGTIPNWTRVVHYTPWSGTRALHVSHGYLLMGGLGYDRFGRWDGATFYADLHGGGSCIWDYEDYNGNVYASAYQGRMWQSPDAINWGVVLSYYDGDMWELETFQNSLYMSYNNGELRASSVPDRGTLVYTAPDGIISMTTYGDNLYFGTGGEAGYRSETSGTANVYKYDGTNVELISGVDEMVTGVQVLYYKPIIQVYVDIKPSSCPNPLNLKSKGVLPVAVLGTEDFDITTIDPSTIQLSREGFEDIEVTPLRWSYEDVATPFEGELCDCHEEGADGYMDLTLKFDTQELVEALGLSDEAGNTIPLTLTGNLKEEDGGTPIEGEDCILVSK